MTQSRLPPCGRPAHRGSKLTPENILTEAQKMWQAQGKIPSIRALAECLQVDPMAIYYYFRNKQQLLEALATALVDTIYQPDPQAPRQQELCRLAESYLHLLYTYSGLLTVLLSANSDGPSECFRQRYLLIIAPCGLSDARRTAILHLLADALHGHSVAIRRTDYTYEQSRALFRPVLTLISELIEHPGVSLS
ncbi:TetR/AcrR family transcriptional regulator [Morganella psychrotolerans]|uniref:TetR/AcrR family transcriptional regulator n=1 Tax=Morganella psychrotolerans TaxID=368603 RepID=UPI0039AFFEDE